MDRPLCKCHGEPMVYRGPKDVGWRCGVWTRAASRRFREKHRERIREDDRRLAHTPGTHKYLAKRGIGLPGEKSRLLQRKRYRRLANAADEATIKRLEAELKCLLDGLTT